jgi:hypothetical protein
MEVEPSCDPPSEMPTTAEEVHECFARLAPHITCQQCVVKGRFTPSKQKNSYICRTENCTGRLTATGVLKLISNETFSEPSASGLPASARLTERPKRTRSVSHREPSTSRAPLAKKASAPKRTQEPKQNDVADIISQIHSMDPNTPVSKIGPLLIQCLQLLLPKNASNVPPSTSQNAPNNERTMPPTTPATPSFAEVLRRHKPEDRKRVNEALNNLKYKPPVPSKNQSEQAFGLRAVTIRGLAEQRIGLMKNSLFDIRIRLGKICNIAKVGKSTYEFLVAEDYMKGFMTRMEQYGYAPMNDYDALSPREADPTQEIKDRIKSAAVTRLARTIESTKVEKVKRYYEAYASERGISKEVLEKIEEMRAEDNKQDEDPVFAELNEMIPDEPITASPTGEASV